MVLAPTNENMLRGPCCEHAFINKACGRGNALIAIEDKKDRISRYLPPCAYFLYVASFILSYPVCPPVLQVENGDAHGSATVVGSLDHL